MKHNDYFRFLEPSTPDDVRAYVMDALRNLPAEWQGYDVSFSQYGLAKMLVDLGHARMNETGTIAVQTTAGHRVIFAKELPFIGLITTGTSTISEYAVIVPAGILIGNTVYRIK